MQMWSLSNVLPHSKLTALYKKISFKNFQNLSHNTHISNCILLLCNKLSNPDDLVGHVIGLYLLVPSFDDFNEIPRGT